MTLASIAFPYSLYLITDEAACRGRDVMAVTEAAVKGGVDLVQLREKNLADDAFLTRALRMKDMLDRYDVPLIINDNLAIAQACHAAGLHVGNTDMPPRTVRARWPACTVLGYSLEYEKQIQNAEAMCSDYLALSPVFATPTKTNTITEWGLAGTRKVRALTTTPLVAIGGINLHNAADVIRAGADCLAVVSAICSADDPARAAERLREEIEKSKQKR
ncbi:thiamine phosphate synthase [Chryseolinea lacunae]|uniref:Thiamine-phosphate synthase n=1 Tax=Chryseolinea lacunae TaxID=2801331 RepID=A0ABS1KLZ4_9BACT|nr:thiamine phosphate synthase [Chryseolinea lacunae]MBL0740348.1 thiamine phosphate synthase [Chryseolinea lacunae]